MFLPRPTHPYYFHADLIWWDGPFKSILLSYSTLFFLPDFPFYIHPPPPLTNADINRKRIVQTFLIMKKLPTYEDDHEAEGVGVYHAGVLPPRAHAPEEGDDKYDHACNKEKKYH